MGWGDEVIAAGQAKRAQGGSSRRVQILDRLGAPRWHQAWEGNPRIARPGESGDFLRVVNGPHVRPYIAGKTANRWTWKEWDNVVGDVWLSDADRAFGVEHGGYIVIEPNTKIAGSNKAWPFERWQRLVDETGLQFVQLGPMGARRLRGVRFVETTFMQAAAVIAESAAVIVTEGALHHVAAAFGTPAIVLWSHFIDPRFTGYATQTNLRHADGWCGSRVHCAECVASMNQISVREVADALEAIL